MKKVSIKELRLQVIDANMELSLKLGMNQKLRVKESDVTKKIQSMKCKLLR